MDHPTATLTRAAERYLLDELGQDHREEFEAHFFECPECAARVSDGTTFLAGARTHLAPDHARPRRAGQAWHSGAVGRLAASLVVVGLLGTVSYQRLVTIPQLQREASAREAAAAAAGRRLAPTFLKASRGEATSVRVATGERFVLVRLSDSLTETYGSYRVTVLDGTGLSRWTQVVPPAEAGEELEVVIPIADLPDGRHQLELEGVPGAGASPGRPPSRASYAFTLVRGE